MCIFGIRGIQSTGVFRPMPLISLCFFPPSFETETAKTKGVFNEKQTQRVLVGDESGFALTGLLDEFSTREQFSIREQTQINSCGLIQTLY